MRHAPLARAFAPMFAAVLLVATAERAASAAPDHETAVRGFVEAFNAHDVPRMRTFVTENVEWLILDGRAVSVETAGADSLASSMTRYFAGCASCRSTLERVMVAGSRVTAMERASWQAKTGMRHQRSLSVYEFDGDRIRRVYYFPVERP